MTCIRFAIAQDYKTCHLPLIPELRVARSVTMFMFMFMFKADRNALHTTSQEQQHAKHTYTPTPDIHQPITANEYGVNYSKKKKGTKRAKSVSSNVNQLPIP